jgi:hypothetical protein
MLKQLTNTNSWLNRITDRANENVWKFFVDGSIWGRMPPQLLHVETLAERDQLGSKMYSLILLEEQGHESIEEVDRDLATTPQ